MRSDRKLVTRRQKKLRSVRADARRKSLVLEGSDQAIENRVSLDEPRCRDLMLPQFPMSFDQFPYVKIEIETEPTTCRTDKGENRKWTERLKKQCFSSIG